MTGAEYRTLREGVGLSQPGAADFHGVAVRTIVHWETGRNAVPAGAAAELRTLDAAIERAVLEAIDLYAEHRPEAVALVRYRTPEGYEGSRAAAEGLPFACHGALIGRIRVAIERLGGVVTIAWA